MDEPDDPTPTSAPIGNAANRELLAIVGNLMAEAHEHARGMVVLYELLRERVEVAPRSWAHRLLDEFDRHQSRTAENVAALRAFAR